MPISRRGGVANNFRKPIAATEYGVKPLSDSDVTGVPTISAGAGVPTATQPNGSIYLRSDAPTADASLYQRIGGAWVALDGAP